MTSADAVMRDRYGLHPRAAHRIQSTAAAYQSAITVERVEGGSAVDARSMLGLVSSGIRSGEAVRMTADGSDEADALAAMTALLEAGVCHP